MEIFLISLLFGLNNFGKQLQLKDMIKNSSLTISPLNNSWIALLYFPKLKHLSVPLVSECWHFK